MKLTELLKQIMPLPWLLVTGTDGEKWIGTEEGDARIATLDGNTQPLDHVYLVHAANVLPELVAAVKHLQANWEKNLTEPMARLNQALAKAETSNRRRTSMEAQNQRPSVKCRQARPKPNSSVGLTRGPVLIRCAHNE